MDFQSILMAGEVVLSLSWLFMFKFMISYEEDLEKVKKALVSLEQTRVSQYRLNQQISAFSHMMCERVESLENQITIAEEVDISPSVSRGEVQGPAPDPEGVPG